MVGDFVLSLDFFAAVITLCYILKLVFFSDNLFGGISLHRIPFEKRSLLNQNIVPR